MNTLALIAITWIGKEYRFIRAGTKLTSLFSV